MVPIMWKFPTRPWFPRGCLILGGRDYLNGLTFFGWFGNPKSKETSIYYHELGYRYGNPVHQAVWIKKKRHILTQWERVFFPHVKPFRSGDSLVALKEWRAYVSPEEAGWCRWWSVVTNAAPRPADWHHDCSASTMISSTSHFLTPHWNAASEIWELQHSFV